MNKLGVALTTALCLAGTANAQLRPSGPTGGQAPTYAVEGFDLGSRVKFDSSVYREYKCGPSDQFNGFTWCQKTRRESGRRGFFEATYSILHSKDGTVVYVNRHQQPAFFDANEADREIQNYSRKFAESPQKMRMPRRSGTSDAIVASWGKVELQPLDDDGVKLLAKGISPKKGLLIDFVGDFTRSAREGLPIYRIVGGAGFVWAGSFDQKGRGTLRFSAVDASAIQPELVATQPLTAPQNDDQQISESKPELAAAIKARRDAEAIVARLQAELSAAKEETTKAELARTEAEKVAQQARTDTQIARKEFEEARNDANAAIQEIDRLKSGGGPPASYDNKMIIIGISAAAILLFAIWAFAKMLLWSKATAKSAVTEPSIDQDELVRQLAETLGVKDPALPLRPETLADTSCDQRAPAQQEQAQANASGEESSNPPGKLPDGPVLSSSPDDDREISKSVVPDIPSVGGAKESRASGESATSRPENAGSSHTGGSLR